MNIEIYEPEITCKSVSVITGTIEEKIPHTNHCFEKLAVLREFMADDDLQEMTVCSTNIGFVKTFRKQYRK